MDDQTRIANLKDRLAKQQNDFNKKIDNFVFVTRFRAIELILVTIYPILIFFYPFYMLYRSKVAEDIATIYNESPWGKFILSLSICFFYCFCRIIAYYVARFDPLIADDFQSRVYSEDSEVAESTWSRIKRMSSLGHIRWDLDNVLAKLTPIATAGVLYQISFWACILLLPFIFFAYIIGETLFLNKIKPKPLIFSMIAVSVICLIGSAPEFVGSMLGSIVIVVICSTSWILLFSSIALWARDVSKSFAFFVPVCLIAAPVIGYFLGTVFTSQSSHAFPIQQASTTVLTFDEAVADFLKRNKKAKGAGQKQFVFVAASGGGLRAAIWTEAVLRTLTTSLPAFSNRLFLISGVSGGSLGAAHFLAEQASARKSSKCAYGPDPRDKCIDAFMESDFLAGPLASALSTDLPGIVFGGSKDLYQRLPFLRRDEVMIHQWSRRWEQIHGTKEFEEPFLDLWRGGGPGLVINTTSETYGDRFLISNIDMSAVAKRVVGPQANFALSRLSLAEAVSLGSRFPIISDASTIDLGNGEIDSIVDGGYFDNFGSVIIDQTISKLIAEKGVKMSEIVVIQLTNDVVVSNSLARILGEGNTNNGCLPSQQKGEPSFPNIPVLAPINTLDAARTSRGIELTVGLRNRVEIAGGTYVHFGIFTESTPLSWTLSSKMDESIWGAVNSNCNMEQMRILKKKWNGPAQ